MNRYRLSPSLRLVVILGLFLCANIACTSSGALKPTRVPGDPAPEVPESPTPITPPAWYTVFFSASSSGASAAEDPIPILLESIDQAQESVDVAAHEIGLPGLRDALIAAQQRGIGVRVVTESNNMDYDEVQDLIAAGIPVLGDRSEGLMHNKFIVIDRQEVWSGSMNFTETDAYRNQNNLLRLRSAHLAQDYTWEFEEMFEDDLFGPEKRSDTPYPELEVSGTPLEVYFSPDDGTADRLVTLIASAQESIDFLAFSFTSDALAEALLERARAGVTVRGVMDLEQAESNSGGDFENFRQAGLDVRLDAHRYKMHHKVLIIDGGIVVSGSYNFTNSAEKRNDENTLIFYNQNIAGQFEKEFLTIFDAAER